jgi:hypothetical protein
MVSALVLSMMLQVIGAAGPDGAPPPMDPGGALRLELPALRLAALAPEPGVGGSAELGDPAATPADEGRAARLRGWGRALRWSTAGALVVTSALGTLAAINQPTRFGDGRCLTGHPVLGNYGCDRGLSTLHGSSAVLSVTLYTANAVLGLAAPEAAGRVSEAARPWHRALGVIHLGGIVVQPVLGLVAAFPQVIGREKTATTDMFPRNLRTAHVVVGYLTTAAFLGAISLER